MAETVERDFERSVSPGLLEALDGASRCSTPITLDHAAAADIYGTLIRYAAAIEQQDQIIAGLLEAIEQAERALTPFANCVYNDNGDHTISDTYKLKAENYSDTYFARKKARAARDEARRALSEAARKTEGR